MQRETIDEQVQKLIVGMDEQNEQEPEPDTKTPPQEIQDIYVLIVREREEAEDATFVIESTSLIPQKTSFLPAYTVCGLYLFCILATLAFQLYCIYSPPIATVTIIPKSQAVTLTGTLQLGRVLNPITISQSQTTPTTGKGHQDAKQAQGAMTFYNGQFTSQTIQAGTILTGTDGIQVVTDQDASIPAANPPIFGQVTISAHAINPGVKGNLPAYDINQACCAPSVLAKNTQSFTGGQDERNFQTVTKADIARVALPLKTAVEQSMRGALQGQVQANEQLQMLPCTPIASSDHQPGEEAREVKITVSQTCSAAAYNREELERKASDLLNHQAAAKAGTSYSLLGVVKVTVNQATVTHAPHPLVFLSFKAQGMWIYALSQRAQQQIKNLLAGKSKQEAVHILVSLPGIVQASIRWEGFGDATRLPKNTGYIHLTIFVM